MVLDENDMIMIERRFDSRYRKVEDCNDIMDKSNSTVSEFKLEFAKSNTKLNIMIGILSTIAIPIIGICVKLLLGG